MRITAQFQRQAVQMAASVLLVIKNTFAVDPRSQDLTGRKFWSDISLREKPGSGGNTESIFKKFPVDQNAVDFGEIHRTTIGAAAILAGCTLQAAGKIIPAPDFFIYIRDLEQARGKFYRYHIQFFDFPIIPENNRSIRVKIVALKDN
jgi:hypothetical protein